jgi:hypothetical protein
VPHLNIKESGSWSYREQDSALEPKLLSVVLIQQTSGASTETILYLSSITFLAVAVVTPMAWRLLAITAP